jgi:hypothetical protein
MPKVKDKNGRFLLYAVRGVQDICSEILVEAIEEKKK